MFIYMIKNVETNECITLKSGKYFWTKINYAKSAIKFHNSRCYKNDVREIRSDTHEIVEFFLEENRTYKIK